MTTFDPHMHIKEVILVGLGGTGAQIARSVARLVYDMGRARLHVPVVRFIDPDTVECVSMDHHLWPDVRVQRTRVCRTVDAANSCQSTDVIGDHKSICDSILSVHVPVGVIDVVKTDS